MNSSGKGSKGYWKRCKHVGYWSIPIVLQSGRRDRKFSARDAPLWAGPEPRSSEAEYFRDDSSGGHWGTWYIYRMKKGGKSRARRILRGCVNVSERRFAPLSRSCLLCPRRAARISRDLFLPPSPRFHYNVTSLDLLPMRSHSSGAKNKWREKTRVKIFG